MVQNPPVGLRYSSVTTTPNPHFQTQHRSISSNTRTASSPSVSGSYGDYYAVSEIISATLPKRTLENWQEVQAQEDAIIKSLTNHFPEEFDEAARGGHVWRVNGSLSQLCETFELFVQSLEAGCTGADDDFYDYWPNAMDMALTFAKDLNKITKTDQFTRRLQKAYESVVRRRPEIAASGDEAWEWPDKQYMQKLQKELDV
jgi:hypothetical protein